jgi:hypothetical protein
LHVSAHLEVAIYSASKGWIGRLKRRHNIAYRNLSGKSRSVDSETIEDWKNYRLLPEIEGYGPFHTNNAYEMVCFSAYNLAKPSLHEDTFVMVVESLNSWLLCLLCAVKLVIKYHSVNCEI